MAKIVLVWELGADLGHISRLDALAKRLQQKGHTVTLALSNTAELHRLYSADSPSYKVVPAPQWPDKPVKLSREPANLSEVLLALGYYKHEALTQRVQAWRQIFSSQTPDLIVFDYAPTALLAARNFCCPKISLDDPFTRPPNLSPLPAYDDSISAQNLQLSDDKLIAVVNQVLGAFGLEKIEHVYDIFHTQKSFLLSVAELDPFADWRDPGDYIGPIKTAGAGLRKLAWKSATPTKVFAYLKPSYPAIREFLTALAQSGLETKIFLPGADAEILNRWANYGLDIATTPFDLADLNQADLAICHGGHATSLQAALQGMPLLIIPLQQEQLATARKCIASGLGLGLGAGVTDRDKITSLLQRLLSEPEFRAAAQACAAKYQRQLNEPALDIIEYHLETLL
jgi:Glycosyl transferases, related to UDP-glucuronosyltransferase